LLEELRNPKFQNALDNIRETIVNLPPQNSDSDGKTQNERDINTEYCNDAISEFIDVVNTKGVNIIDIKDNLLDITDNCIDKLKFAYQCLVTRKRIDSAVSYKKASDNGWLIGCWLQSG